MKVAIYCRLSKEDRNKQNRTDNNQGIQNQKSMLVTYAMEKRWEVYNIYSDDACTCAEHDRPEFNKLLADAKAGKFDIVLCKSQSCFTSEPELEEKYINNLFPLWGIRFIGYTDSTVRGNSHVIKAAIYCRLSEEDKDKLNKTDDSQSIQNQKSMLITHAMENGWEIYQIYSDDDYTGSDRKRPEFNRLLADAEERKFDVVLCKSQSRFTRELELVEKYINTLFPMWGIRFIGFADNADTAVKGNKKARQINGLVNEWYLEDLSENIKTVLTDHRRKGLHIGAFALYGYQKDPQMKGHLIVDPEAADIVREIFCLYAGGMGCTGIARILNEQGIPNPTEYKRQKGLRYQASSGRMNTLWRSYAIRDMLTNEMYIGNMVQGKYESVSYKIKGSRPIPKERWIRVENTHEAIIDRTLWEKVQKLHSEKAHPMCTGEIGLFARKARCMYCGYTMRSTKSHDRYYLKCGTKHIARDACIGSFISQRILEQAVLEQINSMIEKYFDMDQAEEQLHIENNLQAREQSLLKQKAQNECSIHELTRALSSLYMDKSRGILTEADYIMLSNDYHNKMDSCQKAEEELGSRLSEIRADRNEIKSKKDILKQYIHVTSLDRDMIDTLVDYLEIGRRETKAEETPVTIHWNF